MNRLPLSVETRETRLFNTGSDQQEQDLAGRNPNTIVQNRSAYLERLASIPEKILDRQHAPADAARQLRQVAGRDARVSRSDVPACNALRPSNDALIKVCPPPVPA